MAYYIYYGFTSWDDVVRIAAETFGDVSANRCLFRGHEDPDWTLTPGLLRRPKGSTKELPYFAQFVASSARYVPRDSSSWEMLFHLQHHGGDTRLLDWTGSFSTAVFFALPASPKDFSIWLLDAGDLNQRSINVNQFETYSRFGKGRDYVQDFLMGDWRPAFPIAIKPPRFNARIVAQDGYFTFHARDNEPLEESCPPAVTKLHISQRLIPQAREWLRFLGVNRSILFPDSDGLTKTMNEAFWGA